MRGVCSDVSRDSLGRERSSRVMDKAEQGKLRDQQCSEAGKLQARQENGEEQDGTKHREEF